MKKIPEILNQNLL